MQPSLSLHASVRPGEAPARRPQACPHPGRLRAVLGAGPAAAIHLGAQSARHSGERGWPGREAVTRRRYLASPCAAASIAAPCGARPSRGSAALQPVTERTRRVAGGGNPGPAEQRLRPRCPTELRRPRGAEEARPRPPCGGMAAAPRCGEWRRPGAVPLRLLALLALAGAAGAGQLSKWRVPVPMVSAGTAGRLRGREAPGALLARRGTWRSRPRSTWGPSARIQPRSAVTAGQREAAVRAARTERLRDARGARTGGSGPAARLGPGVGRAGPGGAEREARGFPCFCAALCVKLRGENCVKLGLSCRRREQCVFPVRMGAKLQELG